MKLTHTKLSVVCVLALVACNGAPTHDSNLGIVTPIVVAAPSGVVFGPNGMVTTPPTVSTTPGAATASISGPDSVVSGDRFVLSGLGSTFGGGVASFEWSITNTGLINFCDGTNGPHQATPQFCAKALAGPTTISLTVGSGGGPSAMASLTVTVYAAAQISTRGVGSASTIVDGGVIGITGANVSTLGIGKPHVPSPADKVITVTDVNNDNTITAKDVCLIAQGISGSTGCTIADTPANWKAVHIASVTQDIDLDVSGFLDVNGNPFLQEVRFVASSSPATIKVAGAARIVAEAALGASGTTMQLAAATPSAGNAGGGVFVKDLTAQSVTVSGTGTLLLDGNVTAPYIAISNAGSVATYISGDLDASSSTALVPGSVAIVSPNAPVYLPRTRKLDASGSVAATGPTGGHGGSVSVQTTASPALLSLANAQVLADGGSAAPSGPNSVAGGDGGSIVLTTGPSGAVVVGSSMASVLSAIGGAGKSTPGNGGSISVKGVTGASYAGSFSSFAGNIVTIGGANERTGSTPAAGGSGGNVTVTASTINVSGSFNTSGGSGIYDATGTIGPQASAPGSVHLDASSALANSSVRVDGSVIARPGRGTGSGSCFTKRVNVTLGTGSGANQLVVTGQINTSGGYDSTANAESKATVGVAAATGNLLVGAHSGGSIEIVASAGTTTMALKDLLARGGDGDAGGTGCPIKIGTDGADSVDVRISGSVNAAGGVGSRKGNGGDGANVYLDLHSANTLYVRIPNGVTVEGGAQDNNAPAAGGNGGTAGDIYLGYPVPLDAENIDLDVGALSARGGNASVTNSGSSAGQGGSVFVGVGYLATSQLLAKVGKIDISGGNAVSVAGVDPAAFRNGGSGNGTLSVKIAGTNVAHAATTFGDLLANGGASLLAPNATQSAAGSGQAGAIQIKISGMKLDTTNTYAFGKATANSSDARAQGSLKADGAIGGSFTLDTDAQLLGTVTLAGVETKGSNGQGTASVAGAGGAQTYTVPSQLPINLGVLSSAGGTSSVISGGNIKHSGGGQVHIGCTSVDVGQPTGCIEKAFTCAPASAPQVCN